MVNRFWGSAMATTSFLPSFSTGTTSYRRASFAETRLSTSWGILIPSMFTASMRFCLAR